MLVFLCRRFIDSVTDSRPGQLAVLTSAHVADGVPLKVSLQSCKPYSCYIVSICCTVVTLQTTEQLATNIPIRAQCFLTVKVRIYYIETSEGIKIPHVFLLCLVQIVIILPLCEQMFIGCYVSRICRVPPIACANVYAWAVFIVPCVAMS